MLTDLVNFASRRFSVSDIRHSLDFEQLGDRQPSQKMTSSVGDHWHAGGVSPSHMLRLSDIEKRFGTNSTSYTQLYIAFILSGLIHAGGDVVYENIRIGW